MKGEKRIEFDRATVETLTKQTLADAAIRVFGEPGPGEEVNIELSSWGSSSAEIRTIPDPEPAAQVPVLVPVPTVTDGEPF
jgi:hypothetical protein